MPLKAIIQKLDDVDEKYRDLYVAKGNQFEIQIEGIKTATDVQNVQRALQAERAQHGETANKLKTAEDALKAFGDMTPDKIQEVTDKLATLEAAGTPELTKNFEKIVSDRVEALVAQRTKAATDKITKDFQTLQTTYQTVTKENETLKQADLNRTIADSVRAAASKAKMLDGAVTDALIRAQSQFTVQEGKVVTPDGLTPEEWVEARKSDAAHWWPMAKGAGASGSDGHGGFVSGDNPWAAASWNITKQGEMIRSDPGKAERMAQAANSKVGATAPTKV